MADSFYAVKNGYQPGIYLSWAECEKQTKGFPNASFKKFNSKAKATEFLSMDLASVPATPFIVPDESKESISEIEAYVDGSYENNKKLYGYGVVIVKNNEDIEHLFECGNDSKYIESRQIPGEVFGAIAAIDWIKERGYKSVKIYYDYLGIEKWINGEWKAKSEISKKYVELYSVSSHGIEVTFEKVNAHTGVKFNEMADKLAKSSLLEKSVKKNGDGSITLNGVRKNELEKVFKVIKLEDPNFLVSRPENEFCDRYILTSGKNKITINSYISGKTTIQGKNSSFLESTMTLLIQLCSNEKEVIDVLNSYHQIDIDLSELDKSFSKFLPHYSNIPEDTKLDNVLHQAVYNCNITGERFDYSDLPMPMLRSLEFYLHKILSSVGLKTESKNGSNNFSYFDCQRGVYFLQLAHATKFANSKNSDYTNKMYNFYYNNRHTLFHWNLDSDESRTLQSMEEARQLISDGLTMIDEYYMIF